MRISILKRTEKRKNWMVPQSIELNKFSTCKPIQVYT